MNTYTFKIYARTVGALGLPDWHVQTVTAATEEAARLALYETHDHIRSAELLQVAAGENLCPRTKCTYSPGVPMSGVRCSYYWNGSMPLTGRLVCHTCGREKGEV